jgi:hypothetical protein
LNEVEFNITHPLKKIKLKKGITNQLIGECPKYGN